MSSVVEPDKVQSVFEGRAHVDLPKSVFYNPVQEFNRDLTIAVIQSFISGYSRSSVSQNSAKNLMKKDHSTPSSGVGEILQSGANMETNGLFEEQRKPSSELSVTESIDQTCAAKSHVATEIGIRILEGLSASGLRSVRFALEPGNF